VTELGRLLTESGQPLLLRILPPRRHGDYMVAQAIERLEVRCRGVELVSFPVDSSDDTVVEPAAPPEYDIEPGGGGI
jgi:hypothetical protein